MKFLYDFVAGNSRVTPVGVLAGALAAALLVRAGFALAASGVFIAVLLATLTGSVLEKER
jgi:hypothetical protein